MYVIRLPSETWTVLLVIDGDWPHIEYPMYWRKQRQISVRSTMFSSIYHWCILTCLVNRCSCVQWMINESECMFSRIEPDSFRVERRRDRTAAPKHDCINRTLWRHDEDGLTLTRLHIQKANYIAENMIQANIWIELISIFQRLLKSFDGTMWGQENIINTSRLRTINHDHTYHSWSSFDNAKIKVEPMASPTISRSYSSL